MSSEQSCAPAQSAQQEVPAAKEGPPLIEALGLSKQYATTQAVSDVSFRVRRGEVVGFLGPNGAGKSTTLKMLTGYLKPTQGSARVAGQDVAEQPLYVRHRLGYLPENAPLYDDMMVVDFLTFVAELRRVPKQRQRPRLREVAERCGLMDVLGKDIGTLSKGFRQRVGLAQALVHDPDLLILDEPTSGLDPNQIVEIRALITDLGRDKTVLLSTHILSEVRAVCSRAIIIARGRLVADDTPQALARQGSHASLQVVLAAQKGPPLTAAAALAALQKLAGVEQVATEARKDLATGELGFALRYQAAQDVRPALFALAVQNGWCVLELYRRQASLEQTFQRLTGAEQNALALQENARHAA